MGDVLAVGGLIAFFLLASMYLSWCQRIVGVEPTSDHGVGRPADPSS